MKFSDDTESATALVTEMDIAAETSRRPGAMKTLIDRLGETDPENVDAMMIMSSVAAVVTEITGAGEMTPVTGTEGG